MLNSKLHIRVKNKTGYIYGRIKKKTGKYCIKENKLSAIIIGKVHKRITEKTQIHHINAHL